jgi:hypothetical protein
MAIFEKVNGLYEGISLYTTSMGRLTKAILHDGKYRMSAVVGIKHGALVTKEHLTPTDARRYAASYQKRAQTDLGISAEFYDLADRLEEVGKEEEA